AVVTGGFTSTVHVTLPSINLPAGQVSSVAFTVAGANCGPATVTKHGGASIAYGDLGNVSGFDIDVASSSANITRDCTYKIDVGNSATKPAHTSVERLFQVIPYPVLSPPVSGED